MTCPVVVTGLGPVSNIGTGITEFRRALFAAQTGTGPITSFDTTGFERQHGGQVHRFVPEQILRGLDVTQWGRSSLLAAAAARLAADDAGLDCADLDVTRCASVAATTSGESQEIERAVALWVRDEPGAEADMTRVPASRLSAAVNSELGFAGDCMTIATACSAGNYAIGWAHDLISTGQADVVVAAGADSLCRWAHAGFHRLGALSAGPCAPFDTSRDGVLTAEGGAAIVLESAAHAQARGARPYAVVRGYALACDAHHMVAPSLVGITRTMRLAHERAQTGPEQVGYISAHGTGTRTNDLVEGTAVLDVFEAPPPVSSVKAMLGHTMGAASLFGAIACALALSEQTVPPTAHHRTLDPQLSGLDVVGPEPRPAVIEVAQNNGFAFGGNNAIVILGRGQR